MSALVQSQVLKFKLPAASKLQRGKRNATTAKQLWVHSFSLPALLLHDSSEEGAEQWQEEAHRVELLPLHGEHQGWLGPKAEPGGCASASLTWCHSPQLWNNWKNCRIVTGESQQQCNLKTRTEKQLQNTLNCKCQISEVNVLEQLDKNLD